VFILIALPQDHKFTFIFVIKVRVDINKRIVVIKEKKTYAK